MSKKRDNTNVVFPCELVEECVARLPLSKYCMAKQISKHFGRFINSGGVFKLRSTTNLKETSIHMALSSNSSVKNKWYVLEKEEDKKGYKLSRVPLHLVPSAETSLVGVATRIYAIGSSPIGSKDVECEEVGSYNKCEMPRMKATRYNPKTAVVNGKIYVFGGGCINEHFLEVFDPTQKKWQTVDIPEQKRKIPLPCHTVVFNDKIHFIFERGTQCLVFDPKTGLFESKNEASMGDRLYKTSCLILTYYTLSCLVSMDNFLC